MSDVYQLYGFNSYNLDEIARRIGALLGVDWTARSSSFKGDYYNARTSSGEVFELQHNFFEPEGWMEPTFKDYPVLLYISEVQDPMKKESQILGEMGDISSLLRQTSL